jgi:hypothetical protein
LRQSGQGCADDSETLSAFLFHAYQK